MDPDDPPRAGLRLLLAHCAFLPDGGEQGRPARERLEDAVGSEFAQLLVGALTGDKGRGRGRFRILA
jgi:hypothetical protein